MSKKVRTGAAVLTMIFLAALSFSLSHAQKTPPAKAPTPGPTAKVPTPSPPKPPAETPTPAPPTSPMKAPTPSFSNPVIRTFLVNPATTIQGGRIIVEWRVEAGEGLIREVAISSGPLNINIRTGESGGIRTVTIPAGAGAGTYPITLTATDSAGRASIRAVDIRVIADEPVIREFFSSPRIVAADHDFRLRWRVEPSPGGSAVQTVTIAPDIIGDLPSAGDRTIRIPPDAPDLRKTYTLTAVNVHGRFATSTVSIEIRSLEFMRRAVTVNRIAADPEYFGTVGRPVTFHIEIRNVSGAVFRERQIRIIAHWLGSEGGPNTTDVASLRNVAIEPEIHSHTVTADLRYPSPYVRLTYFEIRFDSLGKEDQWGVSPPFYRMRTER